MIWASQIGDFSKIMHRINYRYSMYNKNRYGLKKHGHLWGDRFKCVQIEDDSQLLTCGLYIELNPVRAKICQDPENFAWSSYRYYAFGMANPLIDEDPTYQSLGASNEARQTAYRSLANMWRSIPPVKEYLRVSVPPVTVT